jgi:hypothetical protein
MLGCLDDAELESDERIQLPDISNLFKRIRRPVSDYRYNVNRSLTLLHRVIQSV